MRVLILSSLRRRMASFVAVLISAALGAALVVVAGAFFESGIRLTSQTERLDRAPLIVVGSADYVMRDANGDVTTDLRPFPERHRLAGDAAAEIAGVSGISEVVPVVQLAGSVGDDPAAVPVQNAASAALGPFELQDGELPSTAQEIALSTPLAERAGAEVGRRIELHAAGQSREFRISAVVGGGDAPDTAFLSDAAIAELAGDDTVDAIGVLPAADADPGAVRDGIHEALGAVTVLEGDGRGAAENPAVSSARTPMIVTGAVFGGIVLVVLGTVVSATIGLSVRERAREISLLRAIGATGRQARRLIVGEAMLVGAAGAVIGVLAGIPLAHAVFGVTLAVGMFPASLSLQLGLIPMGIGLVVPLIVLLLSALAAAKPARRSRAIDALQSVELPRTRMGVLRWLFGLLFGAGAIALAIITSVMPPSVVSATGGPTVLAGAISAALLAPAWLRLGTVLLAPVRRAIGGRLAPLAGSNVRARILALSAVTASVSLVVGIGVGNLASQSVQLDAARQAAAGIVAADVLVSSPAGLSGEQLDGLTEVEGVAAASALVVSGGWIEEPYDPSHYDGPWRAVGITSGAVFAFAPTAGSFDDLTGDSIALPTRNAEELGLAVGDRLRFRFGDGRAADLRVAAVFDDRVGYENLVLPADLLAAHTTARTVTDAVVAVDPGISAAQVQEALRNVGDGRMQVRSGDAIADRFVQGLNVQALINALLVAITAAYAAIAVVNTLVVTILARRRELSLLRLSGATPGQVRHVLAAELWTVALTGVVMGAVVAIGAVLATAVAVGGSPFVSGAAVAWLGGLALVAAIVSPIAAVVSRRAIPQDLGQALDAI